MPQLPLRSLLFGAVAACAFAGAAHATLLRTYVTGDLASGAPTIYSITFDPAIADSAIPVPIVFDPRGLPLDGIDFLPGSGGTGVVVGSPTHKIAAYSVITGLAMPDVVVDTNLIAVPPAGGAGTHPSTLLTTPSHAYYIENQFGFGATPSHRIIRKPLAGGPGGGV
jgi:hypothetical protein